MFSAQKFLLCAGLSALLIAAYSNHFNNSFHFDDFHTIQDNVHIRSLGNIPKFFTDARTFSNLPTHQVYRPLLTTSLAVDYVRGGGQTFPFHITTFCIYLLYLASVFALFLHPVNSEWLTALFATAVYGLHPVSAETVNYIVQRADILSTFGVTAGIAIYAWMPRWRRLGLYLIPVVLGLLCKPPALIFPVILFAFIRIFESRDNRQTLRAIVPSIVVCAAVAWLLSSMTAASFNAGGTPAAQYRITQTYVSLHYFWSFFAPVDLSADTDWRVLQGPGDPRVIAGFVFLVSIIAAIWFTLRRTETRPIAFGLVWFLAALFPTSWMPLAEVANDHRMFFPFVGLTLAVVWTLQLLIVRWLHRRLVRVAALTAGCALLVVEARATYNRNQVWRNEETLWYDVTLKSPTNGRGLMNYALTQMAKGDISTALQYLERARVYNPAYFFLEINLGIAKAEAGRHAEAEQHFLQALALEPARYESHFYYARWQHKQGRSPEAVARLETAVQLNPYALDAKDLLTQVRGQARTEVERFEAAVKSAPTPENYLSLSLALYRASRFDECIRAAQESLKLKPDYAEAWNNIAAGHNAMQRWKEGISAADEALRLKPGFELAQNNRAWAVSQQQTARR